MVDISENHWNQLTEYIFKWYPILTRSTKSLPIGSLMPYRNDSISHINLRNSINNGIYSHKSAI